MRYKTTRTYKYHILVVANRSAFELIERLLLKRLTRVRFPIESNKKIGKIAFRSDVQQLKSNVKPPPCVVDRWADGTLTRRPKGPFAVSWPKQLVE